MTSLLLLALAFLLLAASRLWSKRYPILGGLVLFVVSLLCFAGAFFYCYLHPHWDGAVPDFPMLSAGWLPLLLAAWLFFTSTGDEPGSWASPWTPRFLSVCGSLAAIGAFFILRGQNHHPTELSFTTVVLWLNLMLAAESLLAGEAFRLDSPKRKDHFVEAASLSSLSTLMALILGCLGTRSFTFTSPPAMLGCILCAISLFHLLRPSEKPLPIASILVPIWCILWGLALEFA
ncbi:MAG: hypothetical protein WC712_00315 [Candidatus Brocadiia bacterium]